ncbi:unnamed protein product [Effrenium voratum]|nr:unnamed protein product [Effrenium voratum]|mmetsp:Transcript_133948/g.317622  ORF Transcript_133948/g.317622 Transcript_133948/m.317622 type:complete len:178 (+) Transcript_133948:66-599(+)
MGNAANAQCPPWGDHMVVQDAYEAEDEPDPAYEYARLEPDDPEQKMYQGFFRRALLTGIPAWVRAEPEPEVLGKLRINGELTGIHVEAPEGEDFYIDLSKCRQVNVGVGADSRLKQKLQLLLDNKALELRFTDMEHRQVCGHILPLLVDANRGWSNSAWEDPAKVHGKDRRQVQTLN